MAWKHRLIEKNPYTLKGVCSYCGPVRLRWKSQGPGRERRLQCRTARNMEPSRLNQDTSAIFKWTAPHGLTLPQAREFIRGKQCAICGRPAEVVDHNHSTGEKRDALCASCNKGLGFFRDDPERLRAAAAYLELHAGGPRPC